MHFTLQHYFEDRRAGRFNVHTGAIGALPR